MKVWQIVLSAITTASLISKIFGDWKLSGVDIALVLGAIVSVILMVLNAYLKGYDLDSIMQKHSSCAVDLWGIRESYLSLLTEIKADLLSIDEIIPRRDALQEKLNDIYKGAPRTINKAYSKAQEALKQNEELTFSDKEIDIMLPKELRRTESDNDNT